MKHLWLLVLLLSGALLYGESSAQDLTLEEAKRLWRDNAPAQYRMVVTEITPWDGIRMEMWMNGEYVVRLNATCMNGLMERPCELRTIRPQHFTIETLFDAIEREEADHIRRLSFDAVYGYPTAISISDPEVLDSGRSVRIIEFEPLTSIVGLGMPTTTPQHTPTPPAMTPTPFATPFATTANTFITPQLTVVSSVNAADEALATWEGLGVDSYHLHLQEDGVWWGLELIIEVHEGAPRSVMAECIVGWIGGPCNIVGFSMSDYVVEGLFTRLSSAISTNPQLTQQVDSRSGIPARIIYDHPEIFDEEWSIAVHSITLLEANPLQSDTGVNDMDMTATAVAEEHNSP